MENSPVIANGFTQVETFNVPYRIAYIDHRSDGEAGYRSHVFITRIDVGEPQSVYSDEGGSQNCPLAWSGDGTVVYHAHRQIYAIDPDTGVYNAVTDFPEDDQCGVTWFLSCSPDGKTLLFKHTAQSRKLLSGGARDWGESGKSQICQLDLLTGQSKVLAEDDAGGGHLWGADVSWCAERLVYQRTKGEWRVWGIDLASGEKHQIAKIDIGAVSHFLSPDGAAIACARFRGDGITLVDVNDGGSRRLTEFGVNPSWSPDARQIAFMNEDSELWVLDASGGEAERLAWLDGPNPRDLGWRGSYSVHPRWSPEGRLLWFNLTKTHHLDEPTNPDLVEKYKSVDMSKESPRFAGMTNQERERYRKSMIESLYWKFEHWNGIVDFAERKVAFTPGFWHNAAWCPKMPA